MYQPPTGTGLRTLIISVSTYRYKGGVPLQLYLSVTPDQTAALSLPGISPAHVAYRIGPGSTLLRQNLLLNTKGGLLSLSDRNAPPVSDPSALAAAVLRECTRRGYTGVVLDSEGPTRSDILMFAKQLSSLLQKSRRRLFLPEAHAANIPHAVPLICTALSGGDLTELLRQAVSSDCSPALDVQRLRMDFTLPAPSGTGEPLSEAALQHLLETLHPSVFFSSALCTRYFTYIRNDLPHFVLFDDAETLRQKLRIGKQLGYCAAFFQWPEVCDIAEALFCT